MRWLAIALIAAGLVGAAVAQTQDQRPDLAVVSLQVIDPGPAWIEGKPVDANLEVVVRNNGNLPVTGYQLHYSWIGGDGEGPLNEDHARSMDVREETLQPRTERTLTFPWRLQNDQVGEGAVKVVVRLTSAENADANPSDNALAIPTLVPLRAVQVAAADDPQLIHPGEVVFVRFQIFNLGNVAESVVLSAPAPTSGGESRLNPQIEVPQLTVPANGDRTATLFIHYPEDNDPTPFSARMPLHITTSYGRVIEVLTPPLSSTDAPMRLESYANTLSETTPGTRFADPGAPANLHFVATNTGDERDTYTIDALAGNGWSLDVQPRRMALLPGESVPVTVIAEPDHTLPMGASTSAAINLRSEHPIAPVSATAFLRVSGPVPVVRADSPQPAYVGDMMTLSVLARNEGNAPIEGNGSLDVRARFADGSTRSSTVTMGSLQAESERQIQVQFGELVHGGPASYSLQWQAPGGISSPLHEGDFIIHDPRIHITSPAPLGGIPGESVSYRVAPHIFHVRNDGDTAETVNVAAEAHAGRAAVLGPSTFHLEAGETRGVAFEHLLPHPSLGAQDDDLRLTVSIGERPTMAWNETIATEIIDNLPPTIRVDLRSGDWALADPMPLAAWAEDDGLVTTVRLLVQEPGNTTRTIHLVPDMSGMWRTNVQFQVPGNHSLTVNATDAPGNAADGPTWVVNVHAAPVPRIVPDVPVPGTWDIDHPLRVAVQSTVGASMLHYSLVQGDTVIEGDAPIIDGNASIALGQARPGPAELQLKVVDSAGTQSTTTLSLNLTKSPSTDVLDGEVGEEPPAKEVPFGLWPLLGAALAFASRRRQS